MRNFTIQAEAKRLGLIADRKDRWIIRHCERNPAFADKLAASRFVYLMSLSKYHPPERFVIYQWVRGFGWMKNTPKGKKDLADVRRYYDGVMELRDKIFGGNDAR